MPSNDIHAHCQRESVAAANGTFIPEDLLQHLLDCLSEDSDFNDSYCMFTVTSWTRDKLQCQYKTGVLPELIQVPSSSPGQLELEIMIYERSLREGDFMLYIDALTKIISWFFALGHTIMQGGFQFTCVTWWHAPRGRCCDAGIHQGVHPHYMRAYNCTMLL